MKHTLMIRTTQAHCNFNQIRLRIKKQPGGNVTRLISLTNTCGETSAFATCEASTLASPQKFRCWCLSRGNFNWYGGERNLCDLHQDIADAAGAKKNRGLITISIAAAKF